MSRVLRRWWPALVGLAVLGVLAAVLVVARGGGGDGGAAGPLDAPLARADGSGTVELGAPGPARVVNLWATWCAPCRAELPVFEEVARRAQEADAPVEVVGVNVGESPASAFELIEELGLTFPQLLDPQALVTRDLEVNQMPSTILLDTDGEVVEVHAGALDEAQLRALVRDGLGVELP